MQKEKWAIHSRYPDYKISSWGRVINLNTKKFLKGSIHKSRNNFYVRFKLMNIFSCTNRIMGHKLVLETFNKKFNKIIHEKSYLEYQVDHKDANTLNNNLNNLEYVTQSENMIRRHRNNSILKRIK